MDYLNYPFQVEHYGIFRDKAFYTETQEEIKALGASTWKREATQ